MNLDVFFGKKVLVTGHTGFKGSWLTSWLINLGADVTGVALQPHTSPSHFDLLGITSRISDIRMDIRDNKNLTKLINELKPDFVFHLAAQAIVADSFTNPFETFDVNVMGTASILDSLRGLNSECVVVVVTSDKCYENVGWDWGYRENDPLGGIDPYSASKAAAENVVSSFYRSYFISPESNIRIATARAGNVIGGGDWSENRIVPDCIRAWANGSVATIRNPHSTRPWQHVLEPLSGYLALAASLSGTSKLTGSSFNFGPSNDVSFTVGELVEEMSDHWPNVKWKSATETPIIGYESPLLQLNCEKARSQLRWRSVLNFSETVKMTAEWYRTFYDGESNSYDRSLAQINHYTDIAKQRGLEWAV
jgi:CDP-glucose 4,6-dehydratase